MKICSKCKKNKDLNEYHRAKLSKDGRARYCKECIKQVQREYRARNPKRQGDLRRDSQYRLLYGITLEDYNALYYNQDGKCKICKKHQVEFKKRLAVDHNHKTGEVRGLLCQKCNQAIGLFNDDADLLRQAALYVTTNNRP
jgi:hypothetical protein